MEGPGVRTIADRLAPLAGKRLMEIDGRSRFALGKLPGEPLESIFPIGKLLFLRFPAGTLRIHFLMWGRYRLNGEIAGKIPKLTLIFDDGSALRIYASAIALLANAEVKGAYDPTLDPMDPSWDRERADRLIRATGREEIGDSLMDQAILPGVGNIIRNEALFTARIHPASPSGCIPAAGLSGVLEAIRDFSFTWYRFDAEGKRIQPALQIYRKKACPVCGGRVESGRTASLGRISFWCPVCQVKPRCPPGIWRKSRGETAPGEGNVPGSFR
jgi:endonuclease-8